LLGIEVAARDDAPDGRVPLAHLEEGLPSAEPRQPEVEQHRRDPALVLLVAAHRLAPVESRQDLVAVLLEELAHRPQEHLLVLDEEQHLARVLRARILRLPPRGELPRALVPPLGRRLAAAARLRIADREVEAKRRALAGLALEVDPTAVRVDDPVD